MAALQMPEPDAEGFDDLRVLPCQVCGIRIEPGQLFYREQGSTVLLHPECLVRELEGMAEGGK